MSNACPAKENPGSCRATPVDSVPVAELHALRRFSRYDAEHHDQSTRYILVEDLERLLAGTGMAGGCHD